MKSIAPRCSMLVLMLFVGCVQAWLAVAKVLVDHRDDLYVIWENFSRITCR